MVRGLNANMYYIRALPMNFPFVDCYDGSDEIDGVIYCTCILESNIE